MSLKYFGTDGIRGRYGIDPISENFAKKLAYGLVRYLHKKGISTPIIVIGRDTRQSGLSLTEAFTDHFSRTGCKVVNLGVIPTPQVSFSVGVHKANLGLAITASHNPAEDNGFKLFNQKGTKFTSTQELEIEAFLDSDEPIKEWVANESTTTGGIKTRDHYLKHLRTRFSEITLKGIQIATDTANGATCSVTPEYLRSLGAKVISIGDNPDGTNINEGVGSEHPKALQELVKSHNCDLGIAHDGDGDRVVIIDDSGDILSGEHFMAIIARYGANNRSTPKHPLVTTIQSNLAIDHFVTKLGSSTRRTPVGDRNVVFEMISAGASFGGENSGHYVFSDILPTGDGLVAALKLIRILQTTGKKLSELKGELTLFPSKSVNLKIAEKKPLETLPHLNSCQKKVIEELGNRGRILLRYSGTENKLRILVECNSIDDLNKHIKRLTTAASQDLTILS